MKKVLKIRGFLFTIKKSGLSLSCKVPQGPMEYYSPLDLGTTEHKILGPLVYMKNE